MDRCNFGYIWYSISTGMGPRFGSRQPVRQDGIPRFWQVLDPDLAGKASGAAAGLCKFVGAMVPWRTGVGLRIFKILVGK